MSKTQILKIFVVVAICLILLLLWQGEHIYFTLEMFEQQTISKWVAEAGIWGPIIIVILMTIAVVASPIPSAPIALAAGAAYGHTLGTLYIVVGAFCGALIAFGLSRWLGRSVIQSWFRESLETGLLGSQNALTVTVFFSRILPFVSFDMISYAAGLSKIKLWRFAAATLLGVIPTAFLMAHFGEMAIEGDTSLAFWLSLALGVVVALPLVGIMYRNFLSRDARL